MLIKPLVYASIAGAIFGSGLIFTNSTSSRELVVSRPPLPTYTPIPTPTPTPPPPTPTRKPTVTPKPTPIPTSSEEINHLIDKYSAQYGIDPNVMRHLALCESGLNPNASNYIYGGLFQFSASTWQVYRRKLNLDPNPDLRYHPEEAIRTTAYALSLGLGRMWPNCMP